MGHEDKQLQLSEQELSAVRCILQRHIPHNAVWAFGSRARGQARQYSDLDLAVITDNPLSLAEKADLRESFAESDLSFKVDIVDWAVISADFRKIIDSEKVLIQGGQP